MDFQGEARCEKGFVISELLYFSVSFSFLFNRNVFEGLEARTQYRYRLKCMNDFGSSAWSAVVTVSTTKKPQTSEDLQRAVIKGDVETVRNILPGNFTMLMFFFRYFSTSFYKGKHSWGILKT